MLSLPGIVFEEEQHNLQATPSNTVPGTSITTPATANTDSAWVSLIDPVAFDVYYIYLGFLNTFVAATDTGGLFDLAIGPTGGGSEVEVMSDLLVGAIQTLSGTVAHPRWISLPFFIPAGVRLSGRWRHKTATATTMAVQVWLWGGPGTLPFQPFVGMDTYGVTPASSAGTAHTPGSTGAESAWASVGGTTSRDYKAILPMVQGSGSHNGRSNHWEFGYSSTTLGERFSSETTAEVVTGLWPAHPIWRPIPSGTQLQVRAESSGTGSAHEVAIYGLY